MVKAKSVSQVCYACNKSMYVKIAMRLSIILFELCIPLCVFITTDSVARNGRWDLSDRVEKMKDRLHQIECNHHGQACLT